ncbi:MAG TPA: hypothetical protein VFV79_10800, partial [Saprospiraceae bacterium]|nr:hypothetical protein [Saprospiraceae bacterium]
MNPRQHTTYFILLAIISFCIGCKPSATKEAALGPDTREWVQQAFRNVDTMTLLPTFNAERAE